MKKNSNKKHIVIVGFGETGLLSAIYLNEKYKNNYQITAISTKPSLVSGQELGTRLAKPQQWKTNYYTAFERFKHLKGVNIIHGQVSAVSDEAKSIEFKRFGSDEPIEVKYDILLIASGVTNGFWRSAFMESDEQIHRSIEKYSKMFEEADTIAVVGGGPSGASCSYNLKSRYVNKAVHYFYSGEKPLLHYHPKTQEAVLKQLSDVGVVLHKKHRAIQNSLEAVSNPPIHWSTGQEPFSADLVLWTLGQVKPNSEFLPKGMLDTEGFVKVNAHLQVPDYDGIFCVGDVANTDKNRSSARNFAFKLVAKNIHYYARGQSQKMQNFQAPEYRWGSVLGVQDDGMRVYTSKGGVFRFPRWTINTILFPIFVCKGIYRGIKKDK